MSSSPFPCFPFLYFAKFAFNSARSELMSKSKARLFFSEIVLESYIHFICLPWTTCLLSQFLQSISKLKLSLYLCPELLHFSPAFCILPSVYLINNNISLKHLFSFKYLTSSIIVVVLAMPTKM